MMTEVKAEELEEGDIVVRVREEESCCGHLNVLVTVSRSPYAGEAP